MRITIYLDVIFSLNFLANGMALLLTAIFFKETGIKRKIVFGAFVSSLLVVIFLVLSRCYSQTLTCIYFIGNSMGTVFITFGKKEFIKKWLCSTTILFWIGSVMNYIKQTDGGRNITILTWLLWFVVGTGTAFFLIGLKRMQQRKKLYVVQIIHDGRQIFCKMLLDTGNFLQDPVFGRPVMLFSMELVRDCVDDESYHFIQMYEKNGWMDYTAIESGEMQIHEFFHEIEYFSVGQNAGKLICFLVDEIRIEGEKKIYKRQPVAVAPAYLFAKTEYQGLLPGKCLE